MNERYIYKGTKKLRCGYTTGSCAAGASKAAAEMLLTGKTVSYTELFTPAKVMLKLNIVDPVVNSETASCAVVKDSGDDPDITNGIKVYAEVSKTENGIEIFGGEGVGVVTKAGLDRSVGEYAINSVPRKMIVRALSETAEIYDYKDGFKVVISVPDGREIAKKTYNPRMGIEGGISIIGTTGIVEPMSNSAIIETIRAEASMRKAAGEKTLILTIGNYSEQFIEGHAEYMRDRTVTCSNFIGEAIDIGVSMGFENILIVGHIGKLVKLGSGIMNTHSSYADGRMETLMACGVMAGVDSDILSKISDCATTDAALDILYDYGCAEKILEKLTERIDFHIKARVKGESEIGAVIFSYKNDLLLKTSSAEKVIKCCY